MIETFRYGEAALVAPFRYSAVALLGYLVWGDITDLWTVTGVGIVVAAEFLYPASQTNQASCLKWPDKSRFRVGHINFRYVKCPQMPVEMLRLRAFLIENEQNAANPTDLEPCLAIHHSYKPSLFTPRANNPGVPD
jgi:hypothetical protein